MLQSHDTKRNMRKNIFFPHKWLQALTSSPVQAVKEKSSFDFKYISFCIIQELTN